MFAVVASAGMAVFAPAGGPAVRGGAPVSSCKRRGACGMFQSLWVHC